ncbi:MAG: Hsp70 family protein [Deltaproteobacteria bacterium]|nr:Hsp70 family protein [Deltaproteobacteria bacterium]
MPHVQIQNPSSEISSPIVGIDLGTTNSLVAVMRDGVPIVLDSIEGEHLLPSVITFSNGTPSVGKTAKRRKILDATHTVFSVKRLLGRSFQDVADIAQNLP